MEENINTTIEFIAQCIACLSDDIDGVRSNPEIAKIYEDLIQEQITEKLNENSFIFCSNCEKNLRNFSEFRKTCKESWKTLAQHFTEEWACELEKLLSGASPTELVDGSEEKLDSSGVIEDEIFLIESDSEASTIPPDDETREFVDVSLENAIKTDNEIIFVDVLTVANEEIVDGHDTITTTNGETHEVVSIFEEKVDSSNAKVTATRENLVFLGLLPGSTNPEKNICHVCHISSKDINSHYITAHTTVELDTYICSGCTVFHKSKSQIIKHIKTYHTLYLKPRKCTFCDDTFIESGDYRRHIFTHQRAMSKFECNICGKIEKRPSSLKSHIMRVHHGSLFCKYCYKAFANNDEYTLHMKNEEKKRSDYVCDICGYKSRFKQQLGLHIQSLHRISREKNHTCHLCGKKFISSESLRHHVKFMHMKKYKCPECDKVFGFLKDMRNHYTRDHTQDGREACDICGKILKKKSMALHKRTIHSNAVKPFACNVCDKAFNQKIMLKTHMYKHTGFRPYFCNIKECNRGFYDSHVLIKHFLREHGKKVTHEDIKRNCKRKPLDQSQF